MKELPKPGDTSCTLDQFRDTVRFEVYPIGPFGTCGQPLVTETKPLK